MFMLIPLVTGPSDLCTDVSGPSRLLGNRYLGDPVHFGGGLRRSVVNSPFVPLFLF